MTAESEFPHAVAPPYASGWQNDLTQREGPRGGRWTSTPSQPQWTVRFKQADKAAWFAAHWKTGS
jgi:hypothetical protein